MKLTYAAEFGCTGYAETSVFHGSSGGKIVHAPDGVAVAVGAARVAVAAGVGVPTTVAVRVGVAAIAVAVGVAGSRVAVRDGVGVGVGVAVTVGAAAVGVLLGTAVRVGFGRRLDPSAGDGAPRTATTRAATTKPSIAPTRMPTVSSKPRTVA
jgi:hypothetical protein